MSDKSSSDSEDFRPFRPVAELLAALRFLTRLPIPFARTVEPVRLTSAMRMFGVAGALIGGLNGLVLYGLSFLHLPLLIEAAIVVGFSLMVTGALHEDGLADTADGLMGGRDLERRLEIMRDSRIGTYGAAALMLALTIRIGAYQALHPLPWQQIILILAGAGAFSRAMVVDMMWATRSARSDGLSAMAGRPARNDALLAIVTGGAIAIWAGWSIDPIVGIEAMAAALIITGLLRRAAVKLIGGQTGDICGAVQVLAELGMLAAYLASFR